MGGPLGGAAHGPSAAPPRHATHHGARPKASSSAQADQVDELQAKVDVLTSRLAARDEEVQRLRSAAADKLTEFRRLRKELAGARQAAAKARAATQELEASQKADEDAHANLKTRLSAVRAQLTAATSQLKGLQSLRAKYRAQSASLSRARATIQRLQRQVAVAERAAKEAKAHSDATQERLGEVLVRADLLLSEHRQLSATTASLREDMHAMQSSRRSGAGGSPSLASAGSQGSLASSSEGADDGQWEGGDATGVAETDDEVGMRLRLALLEEREARAASEAKVRSLQASLREARGRLARATSPLPGQTSLSPAARSVDGGPVPGRSPRRRAQVPRSTPAAQTAPEAPFFMTSSDASQPVGGWVLQEAPEESEVEQSSGRVSPGSEDASSAESLPLSEEGPEVAQAALGVRPPSIPGSSAPPPAQPTTHQSSPPMPHKARAPPVLQGWTLQTSPLLGGAEEGELPTPRPRHFDPQPSQAQYAMPQSWTAAQKAAFQKLCAGRRFQLAQRPKL